MSWDSFFLGFVACGFVLMWVWLLLGIKEPLNQKPGIYIPGFPLTRLSKDEAYEMHICIARSTEGTSDNISIDESDEAEGLP